MVFRYRHFDSEQIKQICLVVLERKCDLTPAVLHANMDKDDFFFYGISGMDSLDIVEAVMEIERQLNIELRDETIESMYGFSLNRIIQKIETEYVKQKSNGIQIYVDRFSGLRCKHNGKPFCELLGKPCDAPEKINTSGRPYCDFIGCQLYKNFQKLR